MMLKCINNNSIMKESFEIKETFNAKPSEIYEKWLNSEKHFAMTGGKT